MTTLPCLKVGVRMLMDVIKVFDDKNDEQPWECGCRCKTKEVADALFWFLTKSLESFPAKVVFKGGEDNIVSVLGLIDPEIKPASQAPAVSSDTPVDVPGQ